MNFTAPLLQYTLLAPILIVLAGALIGVLIEAVAPRSIRPIAQLSVTLGSLVLALPVISLRRRLWPMRRVSLDGAVPWLAWP